MQRTASISRRTFLSVAGGTAVTALIAGCTAPEASDDDPGNDVDDSDDDASNDIDADFGDWFDNVPNYDGVEDLTGESQVTVMVGADDGFAYDPAAIRIDVGTTVVWEWTGDGGAHDVVEDDGAFESDLLISAGETFEHTFDEPGVFKYYCSPHIAMGMKGGVIVE